MRNTSQYLLFLCIYLFLNHSGYSQCNVTAKALYQGNEFIDTVEICSGSIVLLYADANCLDTNCGAILMKSNFNNHTLGNGWTSTQANPVFDNPCQCPFVGGLPSVSCDTNVSGMQGPDSAFAWVGTTNSNERTLVTQSFDFTSSQIQGCKINFWMMYGITANNGKCEDPDAASEGVHLQYSINNGTSWTDFPQPNQNPVGNVSPTPPFITIIPGSGGYWLPSSSPTAQLQNTVYFWNMYSVTMPQYAKTSATSFRWAQLSSSLTGYDAWGIDNVLIDCSYNDVKYNWSNGINNHQNAVSPANSGWYYIDVYDNCSSNPIHGIDSIYVIVKKSPSTNGIITTPQFACKGSQNVEVSVTPLQNASIYNWYYSGSGATINGNNNTVYVDFGNNITSGYFTVFAENECGSSSLIFSNTLNVSQSPQPAVISQLADTLYSNNTYGNQWFSTNSGILTGAVNQSFIPYNTGAYYLKIFQNGCWSIPSNIIDYISSNIISSESNEYNLTLSPNPASDKLIISYELKQTSQISISLTDINGKEILRISKGKQKNGKYHLDINTSVFEKNIYFLNFRCNKNILIKKLIIN